MTDETCTQEAINSASDGLLNKRGLAVKLNISKRTVDAWMKKRRLPFIYQGRQDCALLVAGCPGKAQWVPGELT
jgi:hypothetical protein